MSISQRERELVEACIRLHPHIDRSLKGRPALGVICEEMDAFAEALEAVIDARSAQDSTALAPK
ncbi:MAG TPA: hypothetical protein VFK80_02365 [Limnochordia bacterium]|nr:hypothetical protein [Limnochordia bacterium]